MSRTSSRRFSWSREGRLEDFRGDSSISTWLMGITINQCRRQRRRSLLRLQWLKHLARSNGSIEHAGQQLEVDQTCRQVRDAVAALPPRDREVIVLFYLEELSVAQISELLEASSNVINVRLHRARRRLKEVLSHVIEELMVMRDSFEQLLRAADDSAATPPVVDDLPTCVRRASHEETEIVRLPLPAVC